MSTSLKSALSLTVIVLSTACASVPHESSRAPAQAVVQATPLNQPGEVGNTGAFSRRSDSQRIFRHGDLKVEATSDSLEGITRLGRLSFTLFYSTDQAHCVIDLPNHPELSCKISSDDNGTFIQVKPEDVIKLYKAIVGPTKEALAENYSFKSTLEFRFMDYNSRLTSHGYQAEGIHGEGATNLRLLGSNPVRSN